MVLFISGVGLIMGLSAYLKKLEEFFRFLQEKDDLCRFRKEWQERIGFKHYLHLETLWQ